ncbi:hypothetical protein OX283_014115 [Flavobacterium sp. SUN052]|uniref:carboxypeptidase-like regulatory domain-containing protein n=1 Tax=Flavobacterium sp. SUN052 TaxID=3002441 RepID=UPI00237DB867|nr:hypothetical protein [Flavobacterium sp. SUN052]MEC4005802.1 hypothetical protein [Flavobacterium sp. SUN052]
MKNNKLILLGLAILTLAFTNCNTASDENSSAYSYNFGNATTANFAGKIVDENNNPISGVTIEMSGMSILTDASGQFSLSNVSVKERFAYMTATKTGFMNGSRMVTPHEGVNNVTIMLLAKNVVATIPTGQSSVVTIPGGTKVTFDGEFVTENGNAYQGNVSIAAHYLSPTDPNVSKKMPGDLVGERTDGSISGMATFGMVNVELYGSNNQKLQLASGHVANISMPIASEQLASANETIPLWYFDEVAGLWKEQGFSRKIGNRYIGNVSHFTLWNNDWAYPVATLNVVVSNADGTRVQGVNVTISSDLIIEKHSNLPLVIGLGTTSANGTLSAGVPTNSALTFKAYTSDGQLINAQILPASSAMTRTVYIVIPVSNKN